ncbi:uncharacterized protein LOC105879054 [Microcebus murinus]|uniref:uncharacterized protein LOC105879054 n=1 Tax=Microcebus murinus TaxID=30608 RepID=UPI003F6C8924
MGRPLSTPLSILASHFKDVRARAHDLSLEVKKGKFVTLCEAEWPAFGLGWPQEGSFHASLIEVKEVVLGHHGHLDQIPYMIVWQDWVQDPPPWLKTILPASKEKAKIFVARNAKEKNKGGQKPSMGSPRVLPDSNLYPDLTGLEWNKPPPYNPGAAPAAPAAQESTGPPAEGPAYGTRHWTGQTPDPEPVKPLPLQGPPGVDGGQACQYWPFSTSDLYNWKSQNANFPKNPEGPD